MEGLNLSPTPATNGHGFQLGETAMSTNLSRNITSRKVFLSLAAAATVAVASSGPSDARGIVGGLPFTGGGRPFIGGGHTFCGGGRPGAVPRLESSLVPRPLRPPRPPVTRVHLPIPITIPKPPFPHPEPPPFHHHHDHRHHQHHWVFRDTIESWWTKMSSARILSVQARSVRRFQCSSGRSVQLPDQDLHADRLRRVRRHLHQGISQRAGLERPRRRRQAPTTAVPAEATPMSEVPTAPNYAGRTYQDYLAANRRRRPHRPTLRPKPACATKRGLQSACLKIYAACGNPTGGFFVRRDW
jgi:hypothetical protein